MKAYKILMIVLLVSNCIKSQNYLPTDQGSKVGFEIKNFGLTTYGTFTGLKGTIVFNPKALNTSQINVSISTFSVNTENKTRDKHLRKEDYFDVEKYPLISFMSTKIVEGNQLGHFIVTGNLIIKGITKSIQFQLIAIEFSQGCVFKGQFNVNRRDFKVGGSSMTLSDDLKIKLNVIAKRQ
jgi:polyisoprenoid-binding protein YceI